MGGIACAASGVTFIPWRLCSCVSPQAFCDAVLEVCEQLVGRLPVGVDVVAGFRLDVSEVDEVVAFDSLRSLANVCHCVDGFLRLWVLGLVFFVIGQGYLSVDMAFWGSCECG